jgi:hypothetical protein
MAPSTKVFSSQTLANFHRFEPEVIPRNYYSQARKDAPVTFGFDKTITPGDCGKLWGPSA